jgi:hypothetical protein
LLAIQIISNDQNLSGGVAGEGVVRVTYRGRHALMIVQNQAVKAGQEDVERMLAQLEALSREKARKRGVDDGL